MQKSLIKIVFVVSACLLSGITLADELPQPIFNKTDFLMHAGIKEMNIETALNLTARWASFFAQPFDAVFVHAMVDGNIKDYIIISDAAMNRLTIWQCKVSKSGSARVIERMTSYTCADNLPFKAPSGMDTNAKNRLFDPMKDVIYVADRGNHRLVELAFIPNNEGGKLKFNRQIGIGDLNYPMDVAISAYGDGSIANADLYVVDVGSFDDDGTLFRYNLAGNYEGSWAKIVYCDATDFIYPLRKPISVACFPDTIKDQSLIYIMEEKDNTLIAASSKTGSDLSFVFSKSMGFGQSFNRPGGIATDDFGRVYAANAATGQIEMFEPQLAIAYDSYGKLGEGDGMLNYPANIVIDSYYGVCEALVIEFYYRFSGLQSFIIDEGAASTKPSLGFSGGGLLKPELQQMASLPTGIKLHEAYPNPFNANCVIAYELPEQTRVRLDIFNVLGQSVATLVDDEQPAGQHQVTFEGGDLASGIYLYKLQTTGYAEVKKALLLK